MAVSLRINFNRLIGEKGNKIDSVLPKLEYKKGVVSQSNEPALFIHSRMIKIAEGVLFFINNGHPLVNENMNLITSGRRVMVLSYHANGDRTYQNNQRTVEPHQFHLSVYSSEEQAQSMFLPGPHLNFSLIFNDVGVDALVNGGVLSQQQALVVREYWQGKSEFARPVVLTAKSTMLAKLTLSTLAQNNNASLLCSYIYELVNSMTLDLASGIDRNIDNKCAIAKECLALINFHGSKRITISEIAETLFCNENSLSRSFKDFYGVSVREYLFQQRMQLANNLIGQHFYTPKQVAEFLGYSDITSFSRAYRRFLN